MASVPACSTFDRFDAILRKWQNIPSRPFCTLTQWGVLPLSWHVIIAIRKIMQESLSHMIDYHITVEETLSTLKQWAGHEGLNLIGISLLRPVKASEVNFEIKKVKKDWLDENMKG